MIDSHCHLDHYAPDERAAAIARAREAGLAGVVTISTLLSQADALAAIVRQAEAAGLRAWRTVGVHPCQVADEAPVRVEELEAAAASSDVIGIGESGLDHVVAPAGTEALQVASFRVHAAAARRTGLPLVVHARGADEAVGTILADEQARGPFPFVMHCFSSGAALAARAVALGGYVSFSGILTFPKADEIRAVAAAVPADRLLVETDAPFLSPVPFRGKRNEPARVVHTASVLASVRGADDAALDALTTANFLRLFRRAA